MIFTPEHIEMILAGKKTQTRRVCKSKDGHASEVQEGDSAFSITKVWASGKLKWQVGKTYAIQPGRNAKGVGLIKLTSIGVDWLQCISDADSEREGYPVAPRTGVSVYEGLNEFITIWNALNTRKGTRWEDNPLVWILTFELLK